MGIFCWKHLCGAMLIVGLNAAATTVLAAPKVIVISLDGAKPALVEEYLQTGVLNTNVGLGRLRAQGISAQPNITVTPSVTAVAHIAIATGSTAVHNDIPANSFHPVAATITTSISGFGAPIGGYQINPFGPSPAPTAAPLWVQLHNAGLKVVTATWPGSDGADISISGTLVQAAEPTRTTDYTVPFGAFGGLGAQGFTLSRTDFERADATLVTQLETAGHTLYSPVRVTKSPVETVYCAPDTSSSCGTSAEFGRTLRYDITVAALDTTMDEQRNYDTLVFFDANVGILPGLFALPATGPAYVQSDGPSDTFFFEGSGNKVGTAFFVTHLAPDLSTVHFARYAASFIPRHSAVVSVVDDVNSHVGFWVPQPDFRIIERLSPGFTNFSDRELERIYRDQVVTFTDYQTRLGQHAMAQNPDADLVMIYFEQPDGSGHQFTLTDPRQATNPLDPTSIGTPGNPPGATGQDIDKVDSYASHLELAYKTANRAVQRIMEAVGFDEQGELRSNVIVVSDHGMAPFHTAVKLDALLANAGINTGLLNIRTTGPATNIYVNLEGREAGGTVTPAAYQTLVESIAEALRGTTDPNPDYNPTAAPLFTYVRTRPVACGQPGFCTNAHIGQDSGDVVALMAEGYNFDGTQTPMVSRLGDTDLAVTTVYSVPNFYGAHGHDSTLPSMSAILYAAGPSLQQGKRISQVRNIDIAPTVLEILGVEPAPTVDGRVIPNILKTDGD